MKQAFERDEVRRILDEVIAQSQPEEPSALLKWLDELFQLEAVSAVAEVTVNGEDAGAVIFSPFVVDVTEHLRPGANEVAVRVLAPALNPMIARAELGAGQFRHLKNKAPLPAGLLGPVSLRKSGRSGR